MSDDYTQQLEASYDIWEVRGLTIILQWHCYMQIKLFTELHCIILWII